MAGMALNILNSIPGTRLLVWVYDVSTMLANTTGIDSTTRPWGTAFSFDEVYLSSAGLTALPMVCSTADFKLGDDGYVSTGDAVPGTVRVKMQRTGAYEQKMSFPLIITDGTNPLAQSYTVINDFLKNSRSGPHSSDIGINMLCVQDSYQSSPLPYILENFSVSVSGIGQASPIQCSMTLKGIGSVVGAMSNVSALQFPNRNPLSMATSFSRDKDGPSPIPLTDAEVGTARLANIKDCWVSLGALSNMVQIVNMDLNIQQTLDFRSTAGFVPTPLLGVGASFMTDDHVFMSSRTVSGSFTFLASSAIDPNTGFQNSMFSPFSVAKGTTLTQAQWSSPITMGFGPLSFSMPATYWQPSSHKLSSGSTIYTIRFVARTIDKYGNREIE